MIYFKFTVSIIKLHFPWKCESWQLKSWICAKLKGRKLNLSTLLSKQEFKQQSLVPGVPYFPQVNAVLQYDILWTDTGTYVYHSDACALVAVLRFTYAHTSIFAMSAL